MDIITPETLSVRLDGVEKLIEEKFRGEAKALEIQAAEYHRRLNALNNEHARIDAIQAKHVSREVFDRVVAELTRRLSDIEMYRANSEGKAEGKALSVSLWVGAIVTFVNVAANIALHLIK